MDISHDEPGCLLDRKAMGDGPFRGRLLIAMPSLRDGLFTKSVIFVCAHGTAGAMGFVINQKMPDVDFDGLLEQLNLPRPQTAAPLIVHQGGPVDRGRGFVLHSDDFQREGTIRVAPPLCITGTTDILRAIAEGTGPSRSIFALGYAGWGPGQLEAEIQANSWLTAPADDDLIFSSDLGGKWEKALARLGIAPHALSIDAGRA